MTRRMERAQLLNRLCELRELYKRRGPDDREASVTMENLLDHLAQIWDHAPRGLRAERVTRSRSADDCGSGAWTERSAPALAQNDSPYSADAKEPNGGDARFPAIVIVLATIAVDRTRAHRAALPVMLNRLPRRSRSRLDSLNAMQAFALLPPDPCRGWSFASGQPHATGLLVRERAGEKPPLSRPTDPVLLAPELRHEGRLRLLRLPPRAGSSPHTP